MIITETNTKRFFFILGRPRSGTTLLRFLFDAHPEVSIPFEGTVVWDMYAFYNQIISWNEEAANTLLDRLWAIPKVERWGLNRDIIKTKLLSFSEKPAYPDFIQLIYENFKSEYPKNRLKIAGDKNPTYSLFPKALMKAMPKAKILYLLRDPRDHILSMRKAGLGRDNTIRMALLWKKSLSDIYRIKEKFPEKVFLIKYEKLVAEPEKTLTDCCDFLGISYDSSMPEFYTKKEEYLQRFSEDRTERFHPNLFQPITAGRSMRWKKEMNDHELAVIDLCIRGYAVKAGYELSGFNLKGLNRIKILIMIYLAERKIIRRHKQKKSQMKTQFE